MRACINTVTWSAIVTLMTSASCAHPSHIPDGATPTVGVHVGYRGACGIGCNVDIQDVILGIDNRRIRAAEQAYSLLGDNRRHAVHYYDYDHGKIRRTTMRVSSTELMKFGFLSLQDRESTPPHGRGKLWGLSLYSTAIHGPKYSFDPFFGPPRHHVMIILESPPN